MNTPIVDFVREYEKEGYSRFHMPGHKGKEVLGPEKKDITEIFGADVLHCGGGIIRQSEKNASALFGSGATYYSAEGSTLAVKAMLAALKWERGKEKERSFFFAARNVHRSVIDACALLDLDIRFLMPKSKTNICTALISPQMLSDALTFCEQKPLCVFLTSPDYLGQMQDIAALAKICRQNDVFLAVDNAHGAYLHFLKSPVHPLDLGAALCCDSAHKTLPALTGAAYLHVHKDFSARFSPYMDQALLLFGSTSPSYLILQSLDDTNRILEEQFPALLDDTVKQTEKFKAYAKEKGIDICPSDPCKIVFDTAKADTDGRQIAKQMRECKIECEYADRDFVVLMVSPYNTQADWQTLREWADKTKLREKKKRREKTQLEFGKSEQVMTIREAVFARSKIVPVKESVGKVCAQETVSCPPAIPIAVSGEKITEKMALTFACCGIDTVSVVC